MSFNIKEGIERRDTYEVLREHMPKIFDGREVPVLSTPSMISMIERTSMLLVKEFLPPNYTTVGTRVDVKHMRPAPVGGKVEVVSKLVKVEGRRLTFEVAVYYGDTKIGEGYHERYIVDIDKFSKRS